MKTTSQQTQFALTTFGQMIKAARIEKKMTQTDLADRAGITRFTLASLEKGQGKMALGTAFEIAHIVGIPLFGDSQTLKGVSAAIGEIGRLLPKYGVSKKVEIDDNF